MIKNRSGKQQVFSKIRRQTCHHRTKRLRENNFTQTIFKSTQQTLAKCANSRRSKIGYFSQDIDILDPDKNLLRNLQSTSSQSEALLRTVLIRLRFKREDFFKPIQLLSGGEKVKAALAKILVSDCNVLMLDEPTNHLDLDAVTALEELLYNYPGTLIFTTHDRRLT